MIRYRGIEVDVRRGTIRYGRTWDHIEPCVARLLRLLVANGGRVVTRETIEHALWHDDAGGGPLWARKTLDRHLWHARDALRRISAPAEIVNVWGCGWVLEMRREAQRHAA